MNADIKAYGGSLMVTFLFLSFALPSCSAKTSSVLGSTWNLNTGSFPDELEAHISLAAMIADYSSINGFSTHNWHGNQTTVSNIYQAALGCNDNGSISFYIGEGDNPWFWVYANWWWYYEQQYCIYDNCGNSVFDSEILSQNWNGSWNQFVLLWSCEQGDTVGGYQSGSGKPYGMPFAWLRTTSLSINGYTSPDSSGVAFLGWHGDAPYLTDDVEANVEAGCLKFLNNFYFQALLCGHNNSINDALDKAAYGVWHTGFINSPLRQTMWWPGYMVVYGDGNIHISDSFGPPDVAVTNVLPLKTAVGKGYCMNVSVTAANPGGWNETFPVTAYANEIPFQTQFNLTLTPGSSANLTFTWNTTSIQYPMGNYSISAYAWPVPDEINTANNYCTDGLVALTIPGDIYGQNSSFPNYVVNAVDLNTLLTYYGGKLDGTGSNPYYANADINNDGKINAPDLNILLTHYGQHYP